MADSVEQLQLMINYINNIRDFDGTNPSQLPDFIQMVEKLLLTINSFSVGNRDMLFSYIKNKCTGETREALHEEGTIETWNQVKDVLLSRFGEKLSMIELMDQLVQSNLNGTIESFYRKIKELTKRLNNRRLTHKECIFTAEEIKRAGINVFKNHLPEPSKTIIFSRNPDDINEAYKIIIELGHQAYTQNGPPRQNIFNSNRTHNYNNNNHNNVNNYRNNYNSNNMNNYRNNYNSNNRNNMNNYRNNYNNNNRNNVNNYQNNNHNNGRNFNSYQNHNNDAPNYRNNENYNNNQPYNGHNNRNGNNYNNRSLSQNTKNTNNNSGQTRFGNSTRQTRRSNNTSEPMEIGQADLNFPIGASGTFLT